MGTSPPNAATWIATTAMLTMRPTPPNTAPRAWLVAAKAAATSDVPPSAATIELVRA
jgi:hypothetical protein